MTGMPGLGDMRGDDDTDPIASQISPSPSRTLGTGLSGSGGT